MIADDIAHRKNCASSATSFSIVPVVLLKHEQSRGVLTQPHGLGPEEQDLHGVKHITAKLHVNCIIIAIFKPSSSYVKINNLRGEEQ